jgi:N-acetyl sugar amidotransferase
VLRTEDDPDLAFDGEGLCTYCRHYDARIRKEPDPAALEALLAGIRARGAGRAYDAVVGVSGGVDSSWVLYLARKAGLRCLAVHLDNGWNSELAVRNIEGLVKTLGADLHTHVISWGEFRDLQRAYFAAHVVDIEALSDHAIFACLFRTAAARGIRTVINGTSLATEGFLPPGWVHNKLDLTNIRSIHRAHGTVPLRTFPTMGVLRHLWYTRVRGIRNVALLDHLRYVKEEAKRTLAAETGWRDYGGKHYESVFTRYYQAGILPGKFGIDKRRSHYSTLVCAGQMTRAEALAALARPVDDPARLAEDRLFVMKKLGYDEAAFDAWMKAPPRSHMEYGSHLRIYAQLRPWWRRLRGRPA